MSIRVSVEGSRGCGTRKPGGLYLVSGQLSEPCPRLPIPLDRCPHCGQGIGPARGWTWVEPATVAPATVHGGMVHNSVCPLGAWDGTPPEGYPTHVMGDRAGLIWVGEQFYPTPEAFMAEAAAMGVSRRIKAVPRGFEIGKHWVLLGHRKAIDLTQRLADVLSTPDEPVSVSGEREYQSGIITAFKPTAIEYVVKGDETDEEIASLEERGIEPVEVVSEELAAKLRAIPVPA